MRVDVVGAARRGQRRAGGSGRPHWGNMIYDAPPPCVWGLAHWTNDSSWDVILKGPGC